MDSRKTAGDIVFSVAMQVAQDMIDATQASIRDLVTYGQIFKSMASALEKIKGNLKDHITQHKWASKLDKEKMRIRVRQMDTLGKVCLSYAKAFERCSMSMMKTTEAMEEKEILFEILLDLDLDPEAWDD